MQNSSLKILILNGKAEKRTLLSIKLNTMPASFARIRQYLIAILVISLASWLCFELVKFLGYYIVAFILLILVSVLATILKTGPVLAASVLSILVWNFFFIPPHHTFHIEKTEDILMFSMFGLVAIMSGIFTTRVRRQEKLARQRESQTSALFQLTRELSRTMGVGEIIRIAIREVKQNFGYDVMILPQESPGGLELRENDKQADPLSADELRIAEWVHKNQKKAGRFTDEFSQSNYTFFPLRGTVINPGVAGLRIKDSFSEETALFWETFLAQISNAMEREFLAELARKAQFLDESDRFYKTLFNSVSHELRIPVATILAASDALSASTQVSSVQLALSDEIYTASLRLNRLIDNLLNMSRLESGRIALHLDWYDLNDLLDKVLNELREDLKAFSLKVSLPDNFPLVRMDFGLMEQVLYNLLVNACQYAPAMSEIELFIAHQDGLLKVSVMDRGPGFPADTLGNVFDKFFRANDKAAGGLGLGLSIVKGFTEAHSGTVMAENRKGGGACVTVLLPVEVLYGNDLSIDKDDT